jgi:hypothetical protein
MSSHHRHSRRHGAAAGGASASQSGSRRSAAASGHAEPPSRTRRHRHTASGKRRSAADGKRPPRGLRFSLLCLLFSLLGLATALVAEIVSHATREPSLPFLNLLGGAATIAALGTGIYAIATLVRHNSRRVQLRTLVGMTVAVCTGLAVISNLFDNHRRLAAPETAAPPAAAAQSTPEKDDLIKPGWYGELLSGGVHLIVTSFEESASESRRFNRGLFKPVSYATLTVINTATDCPVSLSAFETRLTLDDGTSIKSLSLHDLLAHGVGHSEQLGKRLVERQTIAMGSMVPDIPICMDAGFSWARVAVVEIRLGALTVSVPGRFMTAQEKSDMLQRILPAQSPDGKPNAAGAENQNP